MDQRTLFNKTRRAPVFFLLSLCYLKTSLDIAVFEQSLECVFLNQVLPYSFEWLRVLSEYERNSIFAFSLTAVIFFCGRTAARHRCNVNRRYCVYVTLPCICCFNAGYPPAFYFCVLLVLLSTFTTVCTVELRYNRLGYNAQTR